MEGEGVHDDLKLHESLHTRNVFHAVCTTYVRLVFHLCFTTTNNKKEVR